MAKTSISAKTAWQSHTSFMLGISMGSQNHEGEALEAIVERINAGGFTSGVIDVADTLNRYRYIGDGVQPEDAMDISRNEGDEWLKRNWHILAKLKMPISIHRWDEWINHQKYSESIKEIRNICSSSPLLREALEDDIDNFYKRNYGRTAVSQERRALSAEYYMEELAVAAVMLREKPSLVMYPGKQLNCFRLIREGKIPDAPRSLSTSSYSRLIIHSFQRPPAINPNKRIAATP